MRIVIPDQCKLGSYSHELAFALKTRGHDVIIGSDAVISEGLEADILGIQWPRSFFLSEKEKKITLAEVDYLKEKLSLLKSRALIIAFVHNISTRKANPPLEKLFKVCYESADGLIHLGHRSVSELVNKYPDSNLSSKPTLIINHGLFEQLKDGLSNNIDNKDVESQFRIFVPGAIRKYSEIKFILEAFLRANIHGKQITIAGGNGIFTSSSWTKYPIREVVRNLPGVYLYGRHLNNQEMCEQVILSDIVLSPRLEGANSGIPYLAATFNKKCIGPNIGNIGEAISSLGGITFSPNRVQSLKEALELAYQKRHLNYSDKFIPPPWSEIVQRIEEFALDLRNLRF